MTNWAPLIQQGMQVEANSALAEFTTFQLGGPASAVLTCSTPALLKTTFSYMRENAVDFILIGGGSNLLVSDAGIPCVVVRYISPEPLIERDGYEITVSGSTRLDDLVLFAAQNGMQGVNYASGIPGTVGGAIAGNAGAYGRQIGDVVKTVTVITRDGELRELYPEEMNFSYRDSRLKRSGDIVVQARLLMIPGNTVDLLKERQDILTIRRDKHPDPRVLPSAGSFFRNLEPTSKAGRRQAAGWFLEEAGAKLMQHGGAGVFEKHANIIVKRKPDCLAQDVYDLSKQMMAAVKTFHGFDLVREVRLVGPFAGAAYDPKQIFW